MAPTQPKHLAIWNSARDAWETPQTEGLFCEHLDVFSETFPTSGMTVNGAAYELPTWEPATDVSESSSLPDVLMPTPMTGYSGRDAETWLSQRPAGNGQRRTIISDLRIVVEEVLQCHLLPTPTVGMMMGGSETRSGARSSEKLLPGVAKELALLPSPRASEGDKGGPNMRGSKGDLMLSSAVHRLTGETTSQPSDAGKQSWEDVPLPLLNQPDATADSA